MDNANIGVVQHPPIDPSQMVPMGQDAEYQKAPNTSSGETPQNSDVGTDQTQAPEGKPGEGEEKLFAGKFKSVEDLERSYQELQSHNTKVEMKAAEYEKLLNPEELTESKPDESGTETIQSDDVERIRPVLQREVSKILSPVITNMEAQYLYNKCGNDPLNYSKEITEIKKTKPYLSTEEAYRLASWQNLQRTSYNQGVVKANTVNEQKQKAVVESSKPSGYRPASIEDAIKSSDTSVEEIAEAMGPEWKAFAEISKQKKRLGN